MCKNYFKKLKFCGLSVKIAPDLKEKQVFIAKNFKNWVSFWCQNVSFTEKMGALSDSTQFCQKNMGSLGEIANDLWGLWVRAMLKMGFLTAFHTLSNLSLMKTH